MNVLTLYRHTVKHTEPMPEGLRPDVVTYYQTDWSSVKNICLSKESNKEIVFIEEKTLVID